MDVDKEYNGQQVLQMAKSLSLEDISVLFAATDHREEGLQCCRRNQTSEGSQHLAIARRMVTAPALSEQGQMIGLSYQAAADAYLAYKLHNYHEAKEQLQLAISTCARLANEYGYSAEVRLVHLAANLVRVLVLNNEAQLALSVSLGLADYLAGYDDAWPLSVGKLSPPISRMSPDEKDVVSNQLLHQVAFCISNASASMRDIMRDALDNMDSRDIVRTSQPHQWLGAILALELGDIGRFARFAILFFESGPGALTGPWRGLESRLRQLA